MLVSAKRGESRPQATCFRKIFDSLGELVAIKIASESIKLEMERLPIQKIMLSSDSQSAVVILTLGWENKSHKAIILEIKQTMDILKSQNVKIELNWTPGHADIAGNKKLLISWPKKPQKKQRICQKW